MLGATIQPLAELQALAQAHAPAAIQGLLAIAANPDSPAAARVAAYSTLLDRALGRPPQAADTSAQPEPFAFMDDAQREAANIQLLADLRQAVGAKAREPSPKL